MFSGQTGQPRCKLADVTDLMCPLDQVCRWLDPGGHLWGSCQVPVWLLTRPRWGVEGGSWRDRRKWSGWGLYFWGWAISQSLGHSFALCPGLFVFFPPIKKSVFYCGKIYIAILMVKNYHFNHFKCINYGIKYIHIVVQPSLLSTSKCFSSFQTETPWPY